MKKRTSVLLLGFLIPAFLLAGCMKEINPDHPPDDLIDSDKYVDLLTELFLLESYENAVRFEVNIDSLRLEVFRKYGVDESQFMDAHAYYQQNTETQVDRMNEAIKRLQMQRSRLDSLIREGNNRSNSN